MSRFSGFRLAVLPFCRAPFEYHEASLQRVLEAVGMGSRTYALDIRADEQMVEQGHGPRPAGEEDVVDVQLHCVLDFGRDECRRLGVGV